MFIERDVHAGSCFILTESARRCSSQRPEEVHSEVDLAWPQHTNNRSFVAITCSTSFPINPYTRAAASIRYHGNVASQTTRQVICEVTVTRQSQLTQSFAFWIIQSSINQSNQNQSPSCCDYVSRKYANDSHWVLVTITPATQLAHQPGC